MENELVVAQVGYVCLSKVHVYDDNDDTTMAKDKLGSGELKNF